MFPGGMKLNEFVKLYKQNNANEPPKKRDRLNSLEMLSINIKERKLSSVNIEIEKSLGLD